MKKKYTYTNDFLVIGNVTGGIVLDKERYVIENEMVSSPKELYELLCHSQLVQRRGTRVRGSQNHILLWQMDPIHSIWTKLDGT